MKNEKRTEYEQLSEAIKLATNSHHGQFDAGGKPYILHPLLLMHQLMYDIELAIMGVLHDMIEDSHDDIDDWRVEKDLAGLRHIGFSERILAGINLLTHRPADDYLDVYIKNICTNYDAVRVKRKDLEHNASITRLKGITPKDEARMYKYHEAYLILGEAKKEFKKIGASSR